MRCVLLSHTYIKDDNIIHWPNCVEITPSPEQGQPQIQSLPRAALENSAVASADSSSSTRSARVVCEECDEEEAATFKCHDCSMFYCTDHGNAHLKSKSTNSHRTERICEDAATSSNRSEQRSHATRCPLHPNSKLSWCCIPCKEFLCETCKTVNKVHIQHADQVLTIAYAAQDVCTALQERASHQASDTLSKIGDARTAASILADSEVLKEVSNTVSTQITEEFTKLENALKERGGELLCRIPGSQCDRTPKSLRAATEYRRVASRQAQHNPGANQYSWLGPSSTPHDQQTETVSFTL